MSKRSFKTAMERNKVFAMPINNDKNGRPTAFRITSKNGFKRVVPNGLSV